ncbi:unnamed protein product [Ceutorhynchus assimilis]|uniref:Uncharacterized protein n=1 Tax=Ceutorhynchus assimilis TaxID=467358 RepID=A0A9N9MIW3_9CUCU|nr:unnamed protein product [Ceutorhynchus assimilis]
MERAPAIGIDLGTTFSAAAVYRNGACEIIPNKEGDRLTPSFIYFHPESSEVSVGTSANDLGPQKIDNFLFDIKRIIGRKFDDVYVQKLMKSSEYRYKLIRGNDDKIEVELCHNRLTVCKTPEQISSEILKYLKESASEYLGAKVTEAVISVPAHFSNAQRKATKAAAELAGLKVLKLITEPVAAAIHYSKGRLNRISTLLVFDFGGGTLDVSIIEVDNEKFSVKSVEGDTFLGGRDFDQNLLEHFKTKIIKQFGEGAFNDRLERRVKDACIRLKTKLSTAQNYSIPIYCISGNENQSFTISLTRPDFELLSKDLFARAGILVNKCLKEAGMTKANITDVVLVGGTTRMPKVRQILTSYFSDREIRIDLNPDEAVALGASVQAAFLKEKCKELEKFKVTEITPLSLGMGLNRNLMNVAISKNTPLPTKSKDLITSTMVNNQKTATIQIYEGERKNCEYNNLLGTFTIHDLPLGKSGDVKITTTFTLNEDGILEVDAHENSTGKKNKLVVTIGEYRLCDYKIRHTVEDAEKNKADDEVFEKFTRYFYRVEEICNHVLYNLNKIASQKDRNFVESKCEMFSIMIKILNYKEIDRLKNAFNSFKKSVHDIVKDLMDVDFFVEIQESESSFLSKLVSNLKM